MSSNNKKRLVIMTLALLLTVAGIGGSWAWYKKVLSGTRNQIVMSGMLELELIEDDNGIVIENGYPIADEVGMIGEPFTFRLVHKTKYTTNYILKLNDVTTGDKLSYSDVRYGITRNGDTKIGTLSDLTELAVDQGYITGNATIEYSLRLWIREDLEDIPTVKNKTLKFKINAIIVQEAETPICMVFR